MKCKYPDRKCPSMEVQDNTCLLRNPFDCPMNEQDEFYPLTEDEVNKAYMGSDYHSSFKLSQEVKHGLERVLAKAKQHYEQKIVASSGILHPESDFEQKRLDRPDKEKIAVMDYCYELTGKPYDRSCVKGWNEVGEVEWKGSHYEKADQILALVIPDIEEAKKQERERIGNDLTRRGMVGIEAIPDDEQGFWKGYWQALIDKGQALKETEGGKK